MLCYLELIKVNKRDFKKCNLCYKLFCGGSEDVMKLRISDEESKRNSFKSIIDSPVWYTPDMNTDLVFLAPFDGRNLLLPECS